MKDKYEVGFHGQNAEGVTTTMDVSGLHYRSGILQRLTTRLMTDEGLWILFFLFEEG